MFGPMGALLGGWSPPAAFHASHSSFSRPRLLARGADGILQPSLFLGCTGADIMTITVEAVYENGMLKPAQPLPLREHEKVRVTIVPTTSWVEATAGICGWTGSAEEADRFALDPELDFPPSPGEP
jgi:predicted DNA-binding antitoxin AbrB/MazE fold protein